MNKSLKALLLPCVLIVVLSGCEQPKAEQTAPSEEPAIARTEFTDRVLNFFEYEPLHAAKPSQVRIHLTDLSDGSPVEKAEVTLIVRPAGATGSALQTTAKVGKVTGIYVAELTIPQAGSYDIEFRVKNSKLDERFPLTGFEVE